MPSSTSNPNRNPNLNPPPSLPLPLPPPPPPLLCVLFSQCSSPPVFAWRWRFLRSSGGLYFASLRELADGEKASAAGTFFFMGMWEGVQHVLGLGLEPKELTFFQISLRGIIVFVFSLAMVRLADKRFLAKLSAFDAILGFILASMLARAVNGSAAFFETMGAGFVLVLFHRLLAKLACHWDWFSKLIKGRAEVLVENGRKRAPAMLKNNITEADLLEELRLNGRVKSVEGVAVATIERSGEISVVPAKES